MLFFYLVALPVVACATGWALLWLPSRRTGWLVRLDVGMAWFAALAVLVLVPADVAAALARQPPGHLANWWKAAYWYGFLAQVLVLPIHMEFTRRGEFTVKDRLAAAARYNLLYYALLLGVGLAGLVLLLFSGRLQPANIVGFCIAFSNAYGLVAAIFLLGFGLVAVPRQLWNSADPRGEQRRVWHKAGLQAERALTAHRRLSQAVLTARRTSVLFSPHDPLRPLMDVVLSLANSVGPSFVPDSSVPVPEESDLDIFDRADLARLRREVKVAIKDWEREQAIYTEAVQEHLALQAVVASLEAGPPQDAPLQEQLTWMWRCHLHFWVFRILATLAALCSVAIVVAEATIVGVLPNLSVVSAALHATAGAGAQFLTELLCFAVLAYPCACAYYSLYRLGRFAFYRMVPRHTDAYSLCYSGLLMSRFAAPLAFNFMAAIAMPEAKGHEVPDVTDTVFYAEFGQLMMRQPLIGWQFTTFAPALLVPYMLLLASGVFTHAVSLFKDGAELEFEDDWQNDSYTATGKRLLQRETDNVRNGLPMGLTIEPGAGGAGASRPSAGAAPPGAGSSSSDRLLGMLRGAAAAAAAEQAAEAAAERRGAGWWGRLLAGGRARGGVGGEGADDGGRDGGDGGAGAGYSQPAAPRRGSVDAPRSRLARLFVTGDGGAAGAGYSHLPESSAVGDPPAAHLGAGAGPTQPLRAPARHARGGSGGGGDPFGGLGSPSPSRAAGAGAGGGMKALRAKFMAAGTGAAGGTAGHAGQPARASVEVGSRAGAGGPPPPAVPRQGG